MNSASATTGRRIALRRAALLAALASLPTASHAQATWTGLGADNNWSTAANWQSGTAPVATNTLTFSGSTQLANNNDFAADTQFNGLTFGGGSGAFTLGGNRFRLAGGLTNSSASLQTITASILVDSASTRAFNGGAGGLVLGGSLSTTGTTNGIDVTAGTVTLSGINTIQSKIGVIGNGTAIITGTTTIESSANQAGGLQLGYWNSAGTSTLQVATGGTLHLLGTTASQKSSVSIGNQRTSNFNVAGGTVNVGQNAGFVVGSGGGGIGTVNVSSGTVTIHAGTAINVGDTTRVLIGYNGSNGTINLDGGVLATGRAFNFGGNATLTGSATFNFNGGTLRALADKTDWMGSATSGSYRALTAVNVKEGGAIIDSNGFAVEIKNALLHGGAAPTDGGLVKRGLGTLTLAGASTYNGATVVEAGTLALADTASLASTSYRVSDGAAISVAHASYDLGAVDLTVSVGESTAGLFDAGAGALSFGGDLSFDFDGANFAASYDILDFGSHTGDFASVSISGTFSAALLQSGDVWTGSAGGYAFSFNEADGVLSVSAVPEPSASVVLAGLAALGFGALRRRRAG